MELSDTTLAHLRDEAYAFLAQDALRAKLQHLEQEREAVANTRSPFGLLARRETREKFAHSMRVIDDNESVLKDQLARISGIVDGLHPIIRKDVSTYLASVSPDYGRLLQVVARFDDWARSYAGLKELLVAFGRASHDVRLALAAAKPNQPLGGRELTELRASAERLSGLRHELHTIEQAALAVAPADLAEPIGFPALPDLQRVAWVSRLAVLPPQKALTEVMPVETEVREFLAGPCDQVPASLQSGRDQCVERAAQVLESYWNQLRAHARAHYVEDREVSEIIAMLTQLYPGAGRG